ncbi:MAG: YciI family protein [Haloechinothrix sp.]
MPTYIALAHTEESERTPSEQADLMQEYAAFKEAHAAVLRGGHGLYPTATATTIRAPDGKGGDLVVSDGPYAETKEALTGFFLLECADLDEAVAVAAKIPAAWQGTVEVRPAYPPQ